MRVEIRGSSVLLDGYVNAVGRDSRVLPSPQGRFREQIVPKTFERALMRNDNVDLLFNHKKDRKLGSTKEGNLELREDAIGLRAIATVDDPEVMEKAKKGLLKGWSFGFNAIKDVWESGSDGIAKRMVEDLNLIEVSILDKTPAYIATTIESRGEESLVCEQRTEKLQETTFIEEEKKEEKRGTLEPISYSILDNEITLLKLKGSLQK